MKNRKRFTAIMAGLLAAVMLLTMILSLLPSHAHAAESSSEIREQIDAMEAEREALEAQSDAIRQQYVANENEMLDMVGRKNVIDQEIANLNSQIDLINSQIAAFNLLIADKQDELDEAQIRLAELNEKNKERIRAMEEEGKLSYWAVLFKASSFTDLLDRLSMIEEIAAADQRRLKEMSEVADQVSSAMTELEVQKADQEIVVAELEVAIEEMAEKRAEADNLLAELVAKGEEFELLMEQSEDAIAEMEAQIAEREKEFDRVRYQEWLATSVVTTRPTQPTTRPSGGSGGSGGTGSGPVSTAGWMRPVPYYTLTSPFGMRYHPVYHYYRMHNGVDMACAQGTEIYASRSGMVTTATYGRDAGYYVSINHGDGFASVYMHMTHFTVVPGQYVSQGQVIGYVGSTGASTGPHLHFGISYNGTYVNPMNYVS